MFQYFISSLAGHGCKNLIASTLLERISTAIEQKQEFRVVVVIPQVPAGDSYSESTSMQNLMKWVYKTICRGKRSLLATLRNRFPEVDLDRYIVFCSLRAKGYLLGTPVTEVQFSQNSELISQQIYVHSKCMIIDDQVAIIGSANINDRR